MFQSSITLISNCHLFGGVKSARRQKFQSSITLIVWEADICVQCGKCVIVCPHAAIRAKAYEADKLANAPISFKSTNSKDKDFANHNF